MSKKNKFIVAIAMLFSVSGVMAQGGVKLYGVSPYSGEASSNGGLILMNQADGSNISAIDINYNGTLITGANGLVVDTVDSKTVYIVFKHFELTNDRGLGTLDINTGVVTLVGELAENLAGITMGNDGQMYGVSGDGSTTPSTLYSIDKSTGGLTLLATLGDGSDGETIGFNSDNGLIYTRSGRDTNSSFISVDPSNPTPVQIGGTTLDEAFSMLYDIDTGTFFEANLDQEFVTLELNGTQSVNGTTPMYVKGMIFFPRKQDFIFYDGFETVPPPPVN